MDVKKLERLPPWDWPDNAGETILGVLVDQRAEEQDRLVAAEMAGNFTVINDKLADALLSILASGDETEQLRGKAATSFGPALEHSENWEVDAAWPFLSALVRSGRTKKDLLLATIEAVAGIRPSEAPDLLAALADSKDEDIQEAVFEALAMADMGELLDEDDPFDGDYENDGELTR